MENIIGLKKLKQNIDKYAEKVQYGSSFIIFKGSKPLFKISPVIDEEYWEEVVDFTQIKKGGVEIDEILSCLP